MTKENRLSASRKESNNETDRRGRPALKETGGAFDRPPPVAGS